MNYFLTRLRHFNRSSVVGAAAIVAFGSTLLSSNNNTRFRASVTGQVPFLLQLQDSLWLTWPLPHDFFPQHLPFSHQSGIHALCSHGVRPDPSSESIKDASGDVLDKSKERGCFGRGTIANAAAKVGPAVVSIAVPQDFFGIPARPRICSGTIINKDGTILTCAHLFDSHGLIGPSRGKVKVTLQDGRRFEGEVLNTDLHFDFDIAIVKINSETPLPEAKLGSSSGLRTGDWVITLGSHLTLKNSVTAGIVSCANRKSSDLGLSGTLREFIQTDCACYGGISGGPLINMDGEVVGMNIMRAKDAVGLSFSLPIDTVCKIMKHCYKNGEASGAVLDESKPYSCFGRDTIANAAANVVPAVVHIAAPRDFFGIPTGTSTGTGMIIKKDGTILTCAHLVDFQGMIGSCKGKVEVTLQDGRTFDGKVLYADLHSDIAIVKINSETPLPEVKLGSSSGLCPGDWVIAVGCPCILKSTVTAGIVSCVSRKSSELGFKGMPREYIQTDCACNVGYSGGPLVNVDGEVVGMNIMQLKDADGLSFSLPIASVCKIIEYINKSRRAERPWLGLKMLDLNEIFIAQLKKKDASFPNVNKGILLPMVTPGSPGDHAGFRANDVVIEFDGKPVESMEEVFEILGDNVRVPIKVLVKRANDELVTLTVIPEESNLDV